ncbi:GPI-anchored wall transfer protein 1 [Thozetella sp. PMI_491]|nr:GPI-anchored wall transfer protein 1 [Thozetella sp. PMI_491]
MAAAANATQSYKQLKEDFVSNLTGGTVAEIASVTAVAPAAALLWSVLQARQSFFRPYTPLAYAVDLLLHVGGFLLATTLYASTPLLLNGLLLTAALFVYALPPNTASRRKKPKLPPAAQSKAASGPLGALSTKPFLTTYRAYMMITTCMCILAVDFRLFPRRLAKAETWGTSLMDIGVGSFVFAAGVVGARSVLKERAGGRAIPVVRRVISSFRHSIPLLVLGFIRLLSVKGLEYAEHITEYGVHWNFFFTLGLLPPFVALFRSALWLIPSHAGLAIIIGVVYQVLLETTALKAYILAAPRTDLISMNREGIFSFLGYLAIFLAGQDTGMFVLPRRVNPRSNSSDGSQRTTLLMTIAVWSLSWMALYFLATDYTYGAGLTVSRRMANLPYILFVAAFNSAQIFMFCLVDTVFFPAFYNAHDTRTEKEAYETATSRVLHAYNRNGLAIFLAANLLTGLVNLTVPTLDIGQVGTIAILAGYATVVTTLAVVLDMYDISIKL